MEKIYKYMEKRLIYKKTVVYLTNKRPKTYRVLARSAYGKYLPVRIFL